MTTRYLKWSIVASALALSACAPQSEVRQMHQNVSTLNQERAECEIEKRRLPAAGL